MPGLVSCPVLANEIRTQARRLAGLKLRPELYSFGQPAQPSASRGHFGSSGGPLRPTQAAMAPASSSNPRPSLSPASPASRRSFSTTPSSHKALAHTKLPAQEAQRFEASLLRRKEPRSEEAEEVVEGRRRGRTMKSLGLQGKVRAQLRSLARSKGWKDAKIVDIPLPSTSDTFEGLDATKQKLDEAFPGRQIDVLCCGPPADEADAVRSTPLLRAFSDSMSAPSEAKDAYSRPSRNSSIILISTPYGPRVDLPQPQLPSEGAGGRDGEKPGAAEMSRLSGVLAAEYAKKGVRVNCIAPGFVKTPITAALLEADPSLARSWQDATPLGRVGGVEELKGAAVLFASDASRFTTGTTLTVDGGFSLV
uniref:BY PROTMAP: gi/472585278/gb/EMS22832.1/ D-arabinitol dehydrogenase [Rhodosporidium toruloides NP11] gi/647399610/emb/CDR44508.1/ RHTO0S09e05182g1_1 [Rhodosporidium toruloides] n=1 Tax=Rhodotorula toruloides TaxID=5286 RepID=A0A0K3CMU8_RHOTO